MSGWIQDKDANWQVPYTGGWCLMYVCQAFGVYNQGNGQPDAISAWNAAIHKHYDLPPANITVPVYFSLGNVPEGHIAIRLDDLEVASSTQSGWHSQGYIHPNIDNLISIYGQYNGGCTYLGWSEDLNGITLVHYVEDVPNATTAQVQQDYIDILERPADDGGLAHYVGNYTNDFVRNDLLNSAEYKQLQANKAAAVPAPIPAPTPEPVSVTAPAPAPVVEPPVTPKPVTPAPPSKPTAIKLVKHNTFNFINWLFNLIANIFKGGK